MEELENSAYLNEREDCEDDFFAKNKTENKTIIIECKCEHGHCVNGICVCDLGWIGLHCEKGTKILFYAN